ncbi:MAG: CoA pyrophosphatase [Nitrospinae bacterium]|nr:CoA pyrophosphatase [Nitrospinota bacterium]
MNLFMLKTKLQNDYPIVREAVEEHPQIASVLVVLFPHNNLTFVLMIRRARDLKLHPGEIAFPGGVYEEADGNLLATALRETHEEIGLDLDESLVAATLPLVRTRTGFEVTPYVIILPARPRVGELSQEVEVVFEMPLVKLLSTQQRDVGFKAEEKMVVYWHGPNRVWGASAKILQRIEGLCSF